MLEPLLCCVEKLQVLGLLFRSELTVHLGIEVGARADTRLKVLLVVQVLLLLVFIVVPLDVHLVLEEFVVVEIFLFLIGFLLLVLDSVAPDQRAIGHLILSRAWYLYFAALWFLSLLPSSDPLGLRSGPVYCWGRFLSLLEIRVVGAWAESRVVLADF